jgi:hypothetical protein
MSTESFKSSDPGAVTASAAKGSPSINEPFPLPLPNGRENLPSETRNPDDDGCIEVRPPRDTDLSAVVEAWPEFPEAIKAGIVAMVKAFSGRECT